MTVTALYTPIELLAQIDTAILVLEGQEYRMKFMYSDLMMEHFQNLTILYTYQQLTIAPEKCYSLEQLQQDHDIPDCFKISRRPSSNVTKLFDGCRKRILTCQIEDDIILDLFDLEHLELNDGDLSVLHNAKRDIVISASFLFIDPEIQRVLRYTSEISSIEDLELETCE